MKFVILLLSFFVVLSADEKVCYNVQIVSDALSQKNYNELSAKQFDATCKILKLHDTLTVRCGCYDTPEDASKVLPKFKQKYGDAFISKTYKYRFEEKSGVVTGEILSKKKLEDNYTQALEYYKAKDFASAYALFSKLYFSKLSDEKLNFLFGRSAFESGHYEAALAAFERVEMLSGGNLRNKLEMARTFYMLNMYEEAEITFKEVLQDPNIPKNVRKNIELYLSKVTKIQKKSFTYATVSLDWIEDSNVNYASIDSQYNTNIGTFPTTSKVSDSAIQLYGDLTNVYDIGDKNGFALKNRFVGMLKDYTNQNAYDITYLSYSPSIVYQYTKHLIDFAIGIDDLTIAKQDYLHSAYIMPSYEYAHTARLKSISTIKYQRKFFQRASEYDLNADHYELSYGLQKLLSPHSYLQGGVVAIKEKKHHGSRNDVNYKEYRGNLRYTNQFNTTYGADFFGEYKKRNYADFSTVFTSTREDSGVTLSATLYIKVLQSLQLKTAATYNQVHSNQSVFSYKKQTFSVGLNKAF